MALNSKELSQFLFIFILFAISVLCTATTSSGWFQMLPFYDGYDEPYYEDNQPIYLGTLKYTISETDSNTGSIPGMFKDAGRAAYVFSIVCLSCYLVSLLCVSIKLFNFPFLEQKLDAPVMVFLGVGSFSILLGSSIFISKVMKDFDQSSLNGEYGFPQLDYASVLGLLCGFIGMIGTIYLASMNFSAVLSFTLVFFVFVCSLVATSSTEMGWFKKDSKLSYPPSLKMHIGTLKFKVEGANAEGFGEGDQINEFEDAGKATFAFCVLSLLFLFASLSSITARMFNRGPSLLAILAPVGLLLGSLLMLLAGLIFVGKVYSSYKDAFDGSWEDGWGKPKLDFASILAFTGSSVGLVATPYVFVVRHALKYETVEH